MAGFPQALAFVLRPDVEGGYSDRADDLGGPTNHGVTWSTYDAWRRKHGLPTRDVREITDDEVAAVYHEGYWVRAHCDAWWWPLSLAVFDAAVQHSPRRAIKLLQEAAGADVDGIVGPQTRGMMAETDRLSLLARLRWRRLVYYGRIVQRRESQAANLVGWINRMRRLEERMAEDVGLAA